MKNSIHKGNVHILIIRKKNKYIGICKEFGFVEEGNTLEEVKNRLINSSILLVETIAKNPHLEPSLNVKPTFKYYLLYLVAPIYASLTSLIGKFNGEVYSATECIVPNNV